MKMSEEFELPIEPRDLITSTGLEAAAHAINCHDDLVEALEFALKFIDECPCDPDIYPEQWEAWNKLQCANPKDLLKKAKGDL